MEVFQRSSKWGRNRFDQGSLSHIQLISRGDFETVCESDCSRVKIDNACVIHEKYAKFRSFGEFTPVVFSFLSSNGPDKILGTNLSNKERR